jgi:hypothetical protein
MPAEKGECRRRRASAGGEGRTPASALSAQRYALTVISGNIDPSLVTQGWIGDKPCLVIVVTGSLAAEPKSQVTNFVWGSPLRPERNLRDPESGTVPS